MTACQFSRKIPNRSSLILERASVPRGFINRLQDDHIPVSLHPIRLDLALVLNRGGECIEFRSKFIDYRLESLAQSGALESSR